MEDDASYTETLSSNEITVRRRRDSIDAALRRLARESNRQRSHAERRDLLQRQRARVNEATDRLTQLFWEMGGPVVPTAPEQNEVETQRRRDGNLVERYRGWFVTCSVAAVLFVAYLLRAFLQAGWK